MCIFIRKLDEEKTSHSGNSVCTGHALKFEPSFIQVSTHVSQSIVSTTPKYVFGHECNRFQVHVVRVVSGFVFIQLRVQYRCNIMIWLCIICCYFLKVCRIEFVFATLKNNAHLCTNECIRIIVCALLQHDMTTDRNNSYMIISNIDSFF